jgi:hypothetical protein
MPSSSFSFHLVLFFLMVVMETITGMNLFLIVSGKSTAGASNGQDSSSAFACRDFLTAVVADAKNLV